MAATRAPSRRDRSDARRRLFSRGASTIGSFATIQPNRAAAATSASLKPIGEQDRRRNLLDNWATAAYQFADEIGELGFVCNLSANAGAQCRLLPQEWDSESQDWVLSDNEQLLRVHAAFVSPTGGQAELIRRGLLHLAIGGESYLVATPTEELSTSGLWWEFLSSEEVVLRPGSDPVRKRDGMTQEPLDPDNVYCARMWRSHPRYSQLADSPVRRVLPICREIVQLTQMVDAISKSRLAAQIFYFPQELEIVGGGGFDDADEIPTGDGQTVSKIVQLLMQHLSAPVEDRDSPASLVPLVVTGPAFVAGADGQGSRLMKEAMGLVDIARNIDTWAQPLREEALHRLSTGLDIDPSIVDGIGGMNHWGGYLVSAEFVTKHVRPAGDLLADFVTHAYTRPMLVDSEGMTTEQARRFRLAFDPSPIMARQDEASSARVLHDMIVVSDDTLRKSNGFDSSDKPDDEEALRRMAYDVLKANPAVLGPVLGELAGFPADLDWSKATPTSEPAGGAVTPVVPGGPDAVSGMEQPPNPGFAELTTRLTAAADTAMLRAFEVAGNRVVSRARHEVTLRDRIGTVDKVNVMTMVRPDELTGLGLTSSTLFAGAWTQFMQRSRMWIRTHLEASGRSPLIADDQAALAASNLCNALGEYIETQAHRGPVSQSNGMCVPTGLVVDALASAGVG